MKIQNLIPILGAWPAQGAKQRIFPGAFDYIAHDIFYKYDKMTLWNKPEGTEASPISLSAKKNDEMS